MINIALIIAILLLGKREITGRKIREALDNVYVTLAEGDTEDAVTKDFIVTPKAKGLPIRWISSEKINIEVIGQDGRVTRTSDDVEVYLIAEVELGGQKDHRVFRLVIKAVEPVSIYNVTFYVNNTIYGDIQQIEKGNILGQDDVIGGTTGNPFKLYVHVENPKTITFDTKGGTIIDPITQFYGTSITLPINPEKEGYTFTSWNPAIPATMPANDLLIEAIYTLNEYIITYHFPTETVEIPVTNPNTKTTYTILDVYEFLEAQQDDHQFMGWFTDATFTTPITKIENQTGNLDLYAEFVKNVVGNETELNNALNDARIKNIYLANDITLLEPVVINHPVNILPYHYDADPNKVINLLISDTFPSGQSVISVTNATSLTLKNIHIDSMNKAHGLKIDASKSVNLENVTSSNSIKFGMSFGTNTEVNAVGIHTSGIKVGGVYVAGTTTQKSTLTIDETSSFLEGFQITGSAEEQTSVEVVLPVDYKKHYHISKTVETKDIKAIWINREIEDIPDFAPISIDVSGKIYLFQNTAQINSNDSNAYDLLKGRVAQLYNRDYNYEFGIKYGVTVQGMEATNLTKGLNFVAYNDLMILKLKNLTVSNTSKLLFTRSQGQNHGYKNITFEDVKFINITGLIKVEYLNYSTSNQNAHVRFINTTKDGVKVQYKDIDFKKVNKPPSSTQIMVFIMRQGCGLIINQRQS